MRVPAVPVTTAVHVTTRWTALDKRFTEIHSIMEQIDDWRHMRAKRLEAVIWNGIPENARRQTIVKPDIRSVTDTTISFLVSDEPSVTTLPTSEASLVASDAANLIELVGETIWYELNKERFTPLLAQLAEQAVHRGHIAMKCLWLSKKERGRVERNDTPLLPDEGLAPSGAPRTLVEKEGLFPIFVEPVDPIELVWNLGRDGRVTEVIHKFKMPWDQVIDLYPGIENRSEIFPRSVDAWGTDAEIYDYWNEDVNLIVVDGKLFKPSSAHQYDGCPWIIEVVNPQTFRKDTSVPVTHGCPFCWPMLDSVKQASWADSLSASYLEEVAIATLVHHGIDLQPGKSLSVGLDQNTGTPEYLGAVDHSPDGRIVPLPFNERLDYMRPPPIVETLQMFKQERARDSQLVSYQEGILTGVYNINLSGQSVSQQKQAALARVEPFKIGLDRACTKLMLVIVGYFKTEWDQEGSLVMERIAAGQNEEVKVTQETFEYIRAIKVNIRPKVPINPEAEHQSLYNGLGMDVYTLREVQERVGTKLTPSQSLKIRAAEKLAANDPEIMRMLAMEHFYEDGVLPRPEAAPPTPAPPPMAPMGAAPMGPGGPVPAGPMMGPGPVGPAPAPGNPPGAGAPPQSAIPPEILAQLPPEIQQQLLALSPEEQQMVLQQVMGGGQQGAPAPAGVM